MGRAAVPHPHTSPFPQHSQHDGSRSLAEGTGEGLQGTVAEVQPGEGSTGSPVFPRSAPTLLGHTHTPGPHHTTPMPCTAPNTHSTPRTRYPITPRPYTRTPAAAAARMPAPHSSGPTAPCRPWRRSTVTRRSHCSAAPDSSRTAALGFPRPRATAAAAAAEGRPQPRFRQPRPAPRPPPDGLLLAAGRGAAGRNDRAVRPMAQPLTERTHRDRSAPQVPKHGDPTSAAPRDAFHARDWTKGR